MGTLFFPSLRQLSILHTAVNDIVNTPLKAYIPFVLLLFAKSGREFRFLMETQANDDDTCRTRYPCSQRLGLR
jgi:hypothetical protein